MQEQERHPILFYDGVCGLCNGLVQFLLKRDAGDLLRFAPLQSEFATKALRRHNRNPQDLDTMLLLLDQNQPAERVLARTDAIISALGQLGGVWKLGVLLKLFPRFIRDAVYNLVAHHRYRVFGKREICPLPNAEYRHKFLG
jgi:predicted DCC family thiol-disulfide oxidoreductase YuxK